MNDAQHELASKLLEQVKDLLEIQLKKASSGELIPQVQIAADGKAMRWLIKNHITQLIDAGVPSEEAFHYADVAATIVQNTFRDAVKISEDRLTARPPNWFQRLKSALFGERATCICTADLCGHPNGQRCGKPVEKPVGYIVNGGHGSEHPVGLCEECWERVKPP
jgi:hypothetical protein